MQEQEQHVDVWEYSDTASATLHGTCCPMCGQECDAASLRGSMWHELVVFIAQAAKSKQEPVDVMRLLGQREKQLKPHVRKQLGQRSTYRVQKYLLAKCVAAGIPLLRPNGQPRGKTELEQELRKATH
jgi:hypothetical protein